MRIIECHIYFGLFLLINPILSAQNLVPNPGFELYHNLPTKVAEWCATKDWNNLNGDCEYSTNSSGSPDFLHEDGMYPVSLPTSVFSTVTPFQGKGTMGIVLWLGSEDTISYREYISTPLSQPLVSGTDYIVSFYISNGANNIRYGGFGTNNLGIYFSLDNPTQDVGFPILVEPTFEVSDILYTNIWSKITFLFSPNEAYNYITIGNFRNNLNTSIQQFEPYSIQGSAYYYIDEVCVVKEGDDCSISTSLNSAYSVETKIQAYPNPISSDIITIHSDQIDLNNKTIFVYDVLGRLMQTSYLNCESQSCELSISKLNKGVYFLKVQTAYGLWTKQIIRQ